MTAQPKNKASDFQPATDGGTCVVRPVLNDAIYSVDDQPLDEAKVREILAQHDLKESQFNIFLHRLKAASRGWQQDQFYDEAPSQIKEARAALEHARALLAFLREAPLTPELEFVLFFKSKDSDHLLALEQLMQDLEEYAGPRPKGPKDRTAIYMLVQRICEAYEWLMGTMVTHRSNRKGADYEPGSFSDSGVKVTAIIQMIAPEVRDTEIATAIRYYIKGRRI